MLCTCAVVDPRDYGRVRVFLHSRVLSMKCSVPGGQCVGSVSAWPDWAAVCSSVAGSGKAAPESARAPHPEVAPFSPAHTDSLDSLTEYNKVASSPCLSALYLH